MLPTSLMVADLAATLSLADTSELRVRDAGEQAVVEVDTRPALELNLRSRRFGFTLIYSPWVLLRGQALDRPELLHTGVASASWHTRRLRLWVGQDITWGRRLFLGPVAGDLPASGVGRDPIGPDPTLRPVPSVDSVPYLGYSSTAAADWSWTRRLTVNGAAGYSRSGAADAASRVYLPVSQGPHATASLNFLVTRADLASTRASASVTEHVGVDTQRTVAIVEADERWLHRFSGRTDAYVSAGLARIWYRPSPQGAVQTQVRPVGEAGARTGTSTGEADIECAASLRFAPVLDYLTGQVSDHVAAAGSSTYTLHRFAVSSSLGVTQRLPASDPAAVRLFHLEVAASYRASRSWTVEVGAHSYWQQFNDGREAPPAGWLFFARAAYRDTLLRF